MEKPGEQERIMFLDSILQSQMNLNDVADDRANFLIGISGIMLTIALTQIFITTGAHKLGFMIISITAFLVCFVTIGVIRPRIRGNTENKMYYLTLLNYSKNGYKKHIYEIVKDRKKIIDEYVNEIYDISLELKKRFDLIRRAADILAIGLAISMIFIIFM